MKKTETEAKDELRPEYDLRSLKIRKLGPGRETFGGTVHLEPDMAEGVSDADRLVHKRKQ